jgi:DnaJ-class molecular chaperone
MPQSVMMVQFMHAVLVCSGIHMKRELTLYDILEVSSNASTVVIRAAYRCLTQANHPDKNPGPGATVAIERQAQINDAYAVLSDPQKRLRYDRLVGMQDHFNERRGSGAAMGGRAKNLGSHDQTARAFVFRPLP